MTLLVAMALPGCSQKDAGCGGDFLVLRVDASGVDSEDVAALDLAAGRAKVRSLRMDGNYSATSNLDSYGCARFKAPLDEPLSVSVYVPFDKPTCTWMYRGTMEYEGGQQIETVPLQVKDCVAGS